MTKLSHLIVTDFFPHNIHLKLHLLYTVILRSLLHSTEAFSFTLHKRFTFQSDTDSDQVTNISSMSPHVIPLHHCIPSWSSTVLVQFTETSSPNFLTTSGGSSVRGFCSAGHVLTSSVGRQNNNFLTERQTFLPSSGSHQ